MLFLSVCGSATLELLPASLLCLERALPRTVVAAPPRRAVAPVWSDAPAAVQAGRGAHGYGEAHRAGDVGGGEGIEKLEPDWMPACMSTSARVCVWVSA